MKKGFTLIELLAVIVILAIIALIATPIILDIIESAKNESEDLSKELYLKAVEQAIAAKNLTEEFNITSCTVTVDGNIMCDDKIFLIEVSGIKPCKGGKIEFDNGKIVSSKLNFGECSLLVYDDGSGANVPDLMNNTLTPVIYVEDHWEIADSELEWYDYENQEWANAVILSDKGKNKKIGDTLILPSSDSDIDSSDVLAMFVWIPRYEYKIDTTNGQFGKGSTDKNLPGEIEINFIGKNTVNASNEEYFVHPAFTFGDDNLSGIWVGKFEISHTTLSSNTENNNLACTDIICQNANGLRILPNVKSLRNNNVSNFFFAIRSMSMDKNIFGIDSKKVDSHMIKDSEWGAVAYLSQSKYGKYGNSDYEDSNKEVYESISDYTGGSSGNPQSTTAVYRYDVENSGTGASTTGNIYGIYDMNGNNEYAMGFYLDDSSAMYYGSSSGFDKQFFEEANNLKYFDMYKVASTTSNSLEHKGRALDETLNWYNDYMDFVGSFIPWSTRGRDGIFGFYNEFGYNSTSVSSRVILSSKG